MNILHAWYSDESANLFGSVFYARADGTEVEVTMVDDDIQAYCGWPDKQYCGEVVKFLRPARRGEKQLTSFKTPLTMLPQ